MLLEELPLPVSRLGRTGRSALRSLGVISFGMRAAKFFFFLASSFSFCSFSLCSFLRFQARASAFCLAVLVAVFLGFVVDLLSEAVEEADSVSFLEAVEPAAVEAALVAALELDKGEQETKQDV